MDVERESGPRSPDGLGGNISYKFSDYFTLGGGIRSLPGTRSVEGNFPFWTNVDSRHIADEFSGFIYVGAATGPRNVNKSSGSGDAR